MSFCAISQLSFFTYHFSPHHSTPLAHSLAHVVLHDFSTFSLYLSLLTLPLDTTCTLTCACLFARFLHFLSLLITSYLTTRHRSHTHLRFSLCTVSQLSLFTYHFIPHHSTPLAHLLAHVFLRDFSTFSLYLLLHTSSLDTTRTTTCACRFARFLNFLSLLITSYLITRHRSHTHLRMSFCAISQLSFFTYHFSPHHSTPLALPLAHVILRDFSTFFLYLLLLTSSLDTTHTLTCACRFARFLNFLSLLITSHLITRHHSHHHLRMSFCTISQLSFFTCYFTPYHSTPLAHLLAHAVLRDFSTFFLYLLLHTSSLDTTRTLTCACRFARFLNFLSLLITSHLTTRHRSHTHLRMSFCTVSQLSLFTYHFTPYHSTPLAPPLAHVVLRDFSTFSLYLSLLTSSLDTTRTLTCACRFARFLNFLSLLITSYLITRHHSHTYLRMPFCAISQLSLFTYPSTSHHSTPLAHSLAHVVLRDFSTFFLYLLLHTSSLDTTRTLTCACRFARFLNFLSLLITSHLITRHHSHTYLHMSFCAISQLSLFTCYFTPHHSTPLTHSLAHVVLRDFSTFFLYLSLLTSSLDTTRTTTCACHFARFLNFLSLLVTSHLITRHHSHHHLRMSF
jgi:hypothetical protein